VARVSDTNIESELTAETLKLSFIRASKGRLVQVRTLGHSVLLLFRILFRSLCCDIVLDERVTGSC